MSKQLLQPYTPPKGAPHPPPPRMGIYSQEQLEALMILLAKGQTPLPLWVYIWKTSLLQPNKTMWGSNHWSKKIQSCYYSSSHYSPPFPKFLTFLQHHPLKWVIIMFLPTFFKGLKNKAWKVNRKLESRYGTLDLQDINLIYSWDLVKILWDQHLTGYIS